MQQQYADSTARPAATPVQSPPHVMPQQPHLTKGWLVRLKHWIVGEQDPIEQQMREIARQGLGMVRLAHTMGTIMILAFSLGSAVGICSTLIDSITKAGMFTWAAVPFDIAFVVSVLLVVCFDVASVYASFMVRLLRSRHAPKGDYVSHLGIITLACILESGTFGYMSWKYDDPALLAVAILILVRAVGSPIVALYLNMARQIPISPSDISYHNFLASGKGVIRDVVHLANDSSAPLQDKIELYGASYAMRPHEEKQFERLMAAAEKREARLAQSQRRLPPPRIVAASATLPLTETLEHHVAAASAYKAMHDPETSEPVDPWANDGLHDGYEDEVENEAEALFGTLDLAQDDLASALADAADTSAPKRRSRTPNNSGPRRDNLARSKSMREFNRKLKSDAKAQRRAAIRDAVYAILDEWHADGRVEAISDKELARRVAARVNFDVNPSGNTVARWRGPWQSSRTHKAALEDIAPMGPQELRELVAQEAW